MTFYFGIMSDIDSDVALTAVIMTILFLSSFSFTLGALEFSIRDNPIYNQMLQKIYKELMSMGFVNFIVALFTATNKNERINEWIDIIDFVGYMLFFVAIFFVLHSFYIMSMSFYATKKYAQQHAMSLAEVLQQYSSDKDNFFKNILFHLRYFPVSKTQDVVEFKIIYALFRDTYWLPPKFDYGLYLSGCLERYSLQIINIGFTSWLTLVTLAVVNFLRLKFMGPHAFNCKGFHTDPNSVSPDDDNPDNTVDPYQTVSQRCHTLHLEFFCLCGLFVCFYAMIVFFVSRFYVKRLLCRAGVAETEIYAEFLMFEESLNLSEQMEDQQRNVEINLPEQSSLARSGSSMGNSRRRMSINTFRGQITTLRQESLAEDESQAVYKKLTKTMSNLSENYLNFDGIRDFRIWLRLKIANLFQSEERAKKYENQNIIFRRPSRVSAPVTPLGIMEANAGRRTTGRRTSTTITLSGGPLGLGASPSSPSSPNRSSMPSPNQRPNGGSLLKQPSIVPTNLNTPSRIASIDPAKPKRGVVGGGNFNAVPLDSMSAQTRQSWSTIEQFKMQQEIKKNNAKKGNRKQSTIEDYANTTSKLKLTEDFSEVYFFSSPLAYFRAVEVTILLNSLYLSIWAVNFIAVADNEVENPVMWQLLMLIPLVVCVPLIGEIVKTASLLSAIAELEVDVIGSVLENMEDENILLNELREKIARRLEHCNLQAEKKEIVDTLFYEIDTDRSGFISRYEFRDMLRALHLHYSDHKFKKLFNVIDKDRSGSISQQELTDVVFPEEADDDDFKNRSKIVSEHMEVHKEKMKQEQNRAKQQQSQTRKNWGAIKNMSRALSEMKKNKTAAGLVTSNLMDGAGNDGLETVASSKGTADVRCGEDSSSSSSSDSDSEGSPGQNSAMVGIEVTPFTANHDDDDTDEEKEEEKEQEEHSSRRTSGFSLKLHNSNPRLVSESLQSEQFEVEQDSDIVTSVQDFTSHGA